MGSITGNGMEDPMDMGSIMAKSIPMRITPTENIPDGRIRPGNRLVFYTFSVRERKEVKE
jgi:hypothetical protein